VRANSWHCFALEAWQEAGPAPARLEGVAAPVLEMALTAEEDAANDVTDDSPVEGPAPEMLAANVRQLRQAYERGLLPSTDIEVVLADQYLIDREGTFWAVGVRSGRWYRSEEAEWVQVDAPPAAQALLEEEPARCPECGQVTLADGTCPNCGQVQGVVLPDLSEEAYARIFAFALLGSGFVPESVTDPWEPPGGFPGAETVPEIRCDACQTMNPAGSPFCRVCGAALTCPTCGHSLAATQTTVAEPAIAEGCLTMVDGPTAGQRCPLRDGLRIGRGEDNDLVLKNVSLASRHHAEVRRAPGGYAIVDLGSSNGTQVNGARIGGPTLLAHGDVVTIGGLALRVELPAAAACPSCGAALRPGVSFCTRCGARVA
jgi:ribosomal protein L32